jgi:hypothetical protein
MKASSIVDIKEYNRHSSLKLLSCQTYVQCRLVDRPRIDSHPPSMCSVK